MDLHVLRFFSVIAREGSFLAASQRLSSAQSNLSTKMKQLEEELGVQLFVRSKQGVTLTEEGTVLLAYADKLLNLADEAKARVMGCEMPPRALFLGSMESAAITFLPHLLAKFHADAPTIQLTIETCVSRVATQKVLEQRLDGAFIAGATKHPDLDALELFHETLVLLSDPSHAQVQNVVDMLSLPLLVLPLGCTYRQILETWVASEGILPKRIIEFHSLGALLASVSAGLGVALFPASTISSFAGYDALISHAIPQPYCTTPISFISRKKTCRDRSLERFREQCIRYLSETSGASLYARKSGQSGR